MSVVRALPRAVLRFVSSLSAAAHRLTLTEVAVARTIAVGGALIWLLAQPLSAAANPATTFTRRCSSCHTYGHGVLVGPDLKGVTDRRTRPWLGAWISSSERLIRSGDPGAVAIFNKFKQQRMPDQNLSEEERSLLLDYLAAGGPEADAPRRERRAESATPEEVETGRRLFLGERSFTRGGASCSSCHRVAQSAAIGATFGPDLSRVYARYQDKELSTLLGRGCYPRTPHTAARARLTDDEAFALRAFLRQASNGKP
jgi:cytochrome c2